MSCLILNAYWVAAFRWTPNFSVTAPITQVILPSENTVCLTCSLEMTWVYPRDVGCELYGIKGMRRYECRLVVMVWRSEVEIQCLVDSGISFGVIRIVGNVTWTIYSWLFAFIYLLFIYLNIYNVHMWRSGNNLQESVLSFYHMHPKDQTQVINLGNSSFTYWDISWAFDLPFNIV